jgi:hypothetical protein
MADIAAERLTGQTTASAVPVEIHLVMTDRTLLGDDKDSNQPAHLAGSGPIPADLARRLAVSAAEAAAAWLRRLYATPDTGQLIAMDSQRRMFPAGLARFIEVRDQFCSTPWCDAPIRHIDHALPTSRTRRPPMTTATASAPSATTPAKPRAGRSDQNPAPDTR